MIQLYNGSDALTFLEDGKTYDSGQLAASAKYQGTTKYKTVLWLTDEGAVWRWRYFDHAIGVLSEDEMTKLQEGTLSDEQALVIIEERYDYEPPSNDELADCIIDVSDQTELNTSDINDIMDVIIEITNVPEQ